MTPPSGIDPTYCTGCVIHLHQRIAELEERLAERSVFADAADDVLSELGIERDEWRDAYTRLTGLLLKRFPPRADGLPDWRVEDVLEENERLRASCAGKDANIGALRDELQQAFGDRQDDSEQIQQLEAENEQLRARIAETVRYAQDWAGLGFVDDRFGPDHRAFISASEVEKLLGEEAK